jgi:hypothetical protein
VCNDIESSCTCDAGYAGTACQIPCKADGATGFICSGHGLCFDGASGDGSCTCRRGYWGETCGLECPVGADTPCNNRGLCSQATGLCNCTGNWTGANCDRCQPGYHGADSCTQLCVNGRTNGTTCECSEFWAGLDCDLPCPGYVTSNCSDVGCLDRDSASLCQTASGNVECEWDATRERCFGKISCIRGVCSGHGQCFEGSSGNGTCDCASDYYQANCSTWCTIDNCRQTLQFSHAQCSTLGECECQNNIQGHYDDVSTGCVNCLVKWYGPQCTLPCPCNDHGGCDQVTGECQCFRDPIVGYWDGEACESCYSGYVGVGCNKLNVRITRASSGVAVAVAVTAGSRPAFMLYDGQTGIAYGGTTPFFCRQHGGSNASYETRTNATLSTLGTPISPVVATAYVEVLFEDTGAATTTLSTATRRYRRVRFVRGDATCAASIIDTFSLTTARRRSNATADAQHSRRRLLSLAGRITSLRAVWPPVSTRGLVSPIAGTTSATGAAPQSVLWSNGDLISAERPAHHPPWLMPTNVLATALDAVFDARSGWVLIVGSVAGAWELVAIDPATAALKRKYSAVVDVSGYCTTEFPCIAAHRLVLVSDGTVIVVLESSRGVGVARFPLTASAGSRAVAATEALFVPGVSIETLDIPDLVIDTYESLAYVGVNLNKDPSRLVKFDIRNGIVEIRGTNDLGVVGFDTERIGAFATDLDLRRLVAILVTGRTLSITQFELFAIESLSPTIADTTGGTTITVHGEGFTATGKPKCNFGLGEALVEAVFVDSRNVLCIAPAGGDEQCEGQSLELALYNRTTQNLVLLKRSQTPQPDVALVMDVDPFGPVAGGIRVTVTGFGFVPVASLECLFTDSGEDLAVRSFAIFVTTSRIYCPLPAAPRPSHGDTGRLQISIDGYIFTVKIPFTIIGVPAGLNIVDPPQYTVYKSADVVEIRPAIVHVVDNETHSNLYLDDAERQILFDMPAFNATQLGRAYPTTLMLSLIVNTNTTLQGQVVFRGITLRRPPVGHGVFTFTSGTWEARLYLEVVEGEPYRLYVIRQPTATSNASVIVNTAPLLTVQPVIDVRDISGNTITQLTTKDRVVRIVTATFFTGTGVSNQSVLASQDGRFDFTQVSMRGFHGSTYSIHFAADNVQAVDSQQLSVGLCAENQFGVLGTVDCQACPPQATCNGSVRIGVADGYWRASDISYYLYSCAEPYGTKSACRAGECTDGYTGPRCSVCLPDYGRSQTSCVECGTAAENVVIVVVVALVILSAIWFLIFSSLNTKKKNSLPVFVKILLNHLQVMSQLGGVIANLPGVVLQLVGIQSVASGADPASLAAVDCLFHPNFHDQFTFIVVMPWILVVLASLLLVYLEYRRRKREEEARFNRRDYGAFATQDELEARIQEVGLEDEIGRMPHIDEAMRVRRRQLGIAHAQFDTISRAYTAVAKLVPSDAQRNALRYLSRRKQLLRSQLSALEDEFHAVEGVFGADDEFAALARGDLDLGDRFGSMTPPLGTPSGGSISSGASGMFSPKSGTMGGGRLSMSARSGGGDLPALDSRSASRSGSPTPGGHGGSFRYEPHAPYRPGHRYAKKRLNTHASGDHADMFLDPSVALTRAARRAMVKNVSDNAAAMQDIEELLDDGFDHEAEADSHGYGFRHIALDPYGLVRSQPANNHMDDEVMSNGANSTGEPRGRGDTRLSLSGSESGRRPSMGVVGQTRLSPFAFDQSMSMGQSTYKDALDPSLAAKRNFDKPENRAWAAAVEFEEPALEDSRDIDEDIAARVGAAVLNVPTALQADAGVPQATAAAAEAVAKYEGQLEQQDPTSAAARQQVEMTAQEKAWLDGLIAAAAAGDVDDFEPVPYDDGIMLRQDNLGNANVVRAKKPDQATPRGARARRAAAAMGGVYDGAGGVEDEMEIDGSRMNAFSGSLDEMPAIQRVDSAMFAALVKQDALDTEVQRGLQAAEDHSDPEVDTDQDEAAAKSIEEPELQRTLANKVLLACVVIFLVLYPSLIQKCLLMLKCDPLNYGPSPYPGAPSGIQSKLFSDRSIDCDSDTHSRYSIAALSIGMLYGIGIPLSITCTIFFTKAKRGLTRPCRCSHSTRPVTRRRIGGGKA